MTKQEITELHLHFLGIGSAVTALTGSCIKTASLPEIKSHKTLINRLFCYINLHQGFRREE